MRFYVALILALCLAALCVTTDAATHGQPYAARAKARSANQSAKATSNSAKVTATKATTGKVPTTVKKSTSTKVATSTTSKAGSSALTKSAGLKSSSLVARRPIRTEAELSGMTSETNDQLYGRLSVTKTAAQIKWWVKAGSGSSVSRTFTKKKNYTSQITSYSLDAQYRHDGKNSYRFVSAAANIKSRKPHTSSQYDQAGYYMVTTGYGKTVLPGLECEIGLADITQEREEVDHRVTPVYSLRLKTPLSSSLILDGDTNLVEPWSDDSMIDSRVNLTYKLTPAMSMRFTYAANSVMGSDLQKSDGWDRSLRLALVFSH